MYDFFLRWRNKTPSASEEAEGGEGEELEKLLR